MPKDWDNIATRALVGGAASRLSGGKFANGAFTASFNYLLNDLGKHEYKIRSRLCDVGTAGCTLLEQLKIVDRNSTPIVGYAGGPVEGQNDLLGLTGRTNPITHRVDYENFRITNTTLEGHAYNPGTVVHQLSIENETRFEYMNPNTRTVQSIFLTTTGTGVGAYGTLNNIVGVSIFNFTHSMSRHYSEAYIQAQPYLSKSKQ